MEEAFVYEWYDKGKDMVYLGYHKGPQDDGYVCSSKPTKSEYVKRPEDFTRKILAEGPVEHMYNLESWLLKCVNAARNPRYYNLTENDFPECWAGKSHTPETRAKLSAATKKSMTPERLAQLSVAATGKVATLETRAKISALHLGRIRPPETGARISTAKKGLSSQRHTERPCVFLRETPELVLIGTKEKQKKLTRECVSSLSQ